MGTVYLGHADDGRPVAVKVIHADLARMPDFRRRLRDEADAARRVPRFCTAEVIEVDPDAELPYLVTEYVAGPTLEEKIAADGPVRTADLERLAVAVVAALTAIHGAGLVHRDLKPSNVLLSPLGPRVIDFGIARALDAKTTITRTRQLLGTPAFMAPEQAAGKSPSQAADIFAWGVLVTYAATGRLPFGDENTTLLLRVIHAEPDLTGLDPTLLPLVRDALVKDPAGRPTAHQLFLRLTGTAPTPTTGGGDPVMPVPTAPADGTGPVHDQPTVVGRLAARPGRGSRGLSRACGRGLKHPLIVVGIAAILAAIAVPATTSLIRNTPDSGVSTPRPKPRAAPADLPRAETPLGLQTLVWVGDRGGGRYELYSARVTTAGLAEIHQITQGPDKSLLPAIVPGRRTLVFFNPAGQIDAVAADGGQVEKNLLGKIRGARVTVAGDARPTVSPDGRFMAVAGAEPGHPGIYIIPLDGSGPPRRLPTGQSQVGDPAWSPSGKLIAYWGNIDGGDGGALFTIDAAGLHPPTVITDGTRDADPTWYPDGSKIAFRRQTGTTDRALDIFTVSAGGGAVTRLTTDAGRNQDPTFSPDGTLIAFTSERRGERELYIMKADGKDQRTLTTGIEFNAHPRWESG